MTLASSTAIFHALQIKQRDAGLGHAGVVGLSPGGCPAAHTHPPFLPLPPPPSSDLWAATGPALIFNSRLASARRRGGDRRVVSNFEHGAERCPWAQPRLE